MYDYLEYTVYDHMGCQLVLGHAKDDNALQNALFPDLKRIRAIITGPLYSHITEVSYLTKPTSTPPHKAPCVHVFHRALIMYSDASVNDISEAEIDEFIAAIHPIDLGEDSEPDLELDTPKCLHPNKKLHTYTTFSYYFCPDCKEEIK